MLGDREILKIISEAVSQQVDIVSLVRGLESGTSERGRWGSRAPSASPLPHLYKHLRFNSKSVRERVNHSHSHFYKVSGVLPSLNLMQLFWLSDLFFAA